MAPQNNPEKVKEENKRSNAKALEEKRYYCDICDFAFSKGAFLRRHLDGIRHAQNVADLEDPESYKKSRRAREKIYAEKVLKEKRHYCNVCEQTFTSKAHLTQHFTTSRHAAKAALLEKAAPLEAASPK